MQPSLSDCERALYVLEKDEPSLWRKGRCEGAISIFHSRNSQNLQSDLPPSCACTEAQTKVHFELIFWLLFYLLFFPAKSTFCL